MSQPFLSKSKYLTGIQCPKLLWYHYNAKDQLPPPDAATEALFDQGHEVGELAKRLYPDGIEVKWDQGFDEVVDESQRLLKHHKPLFEAGFRYNGTYARADILSPTENSKWDIIEVKSSTSVKPINYHDLAFQKYCYGGTGIRVGRCCLMHINNEYVKQGDIVPEEFFIEEDITEDVDAYLSEIAERVAAMLGVIGERECPDMDIGCHCDDPYACVLKEKCWEHVWSQENSVFDIGYLGQKAWDLYSQGVVRTNEIPADFSMQYRHQVQIEATTTGQPHIDRKVVRAFLDELVCPLYFLDFETFGTAIPLLDGTRPYQQVPFQFSLHIVNAPGSEPVHHSWLWNGEGDPRPEMLARLNNLLGSQGSIIAYNAGFETRVLTSTAEASRGYRTWSEEICSRMVDLLAPFSSFAVYFPQQRGSTSMKAVLPTLTGKGYDGRAISDGEQASEEFMRVTFADATQEDRNRVRKNLEEYCGLDTMGMVDIVNALRRLV